MTYSADALDKLSIEMENLSPQDVLRWGWNTYGSKLTMATAFGAEGCVIISMLADITKDIYLFNLDTGYQFAQTLETRDRLVAKYGIPIHAVGSEQSIEDLERENGGPLYLDQPDLCCHKRKVIPLSAALQGYEAWISAIRRDQTVQRANAPVVGWDEKHKMAKLNPLAKWTKKDVWDYILENDVPYNPLHDAGYPSIGCWPCTRAIGVGEDERSGRWAGTAKKECGIHVPNTISISA
jgi:phosphoadenosine phosphosulfate reductase